MLRAPGNGRRPRAASLVGGVVLHHAAFRHAVVHHVIGSPIHASWQAPDRGRPASSARASAACARSGVESEQTTYRAAHSLIRSVVGRRAPPGTPSGPRRRSERQATASRIPGTGMAPRRSAPHNRGCRGPRQTTHLVGAAGRRPHLPPAVTAHQSVQPGTGPCVEVVAKRPPTTVPRRALFLRRRRCRPLFTGHPRAANRTDVYV